MSNYQADAFVVVRANTKPFRDDLLKAIKAFEKQPVRVKILPDTRGFQKLLRTEVFAASEKVVARVKVLPDMRAFNAALRTATKGLPAVGGGGGEAAVVGVAGERGPAPILGASGKPLTGAALEVKKAALARQAEELKVTEAIRKAEIKAWAENVKRDKIRAAEDLAARLAVIETAKKAGLVSAAGKPLTGAAALAKAEALERAKANAAALAEMQKDETAAHIRNVKLDKARAAADAKARLAVIETARKADLLSKSGAPEGSGSGSATGGTGAHEVAPRSDCRGRGSRGRGSQGRPQAQQG